VSLAGAGLTIPIAKTIKPADTSTSIVIAAAGPQIQGGQAEIGQHGRRGAAP
jgi:hypothetical protein